MNGRSRPIVDANESFIVNIKNMLEMVAPFPKECDTCIYKVPVGLRNVRDEAYTPKIVSIGPLHHGEERLKKMEVHKMRYVNSCLSRHVGITLDACIAKLKELEEKVRTSYFEDDFSHRFSSEQFVIMMLLDSFFIIELFILKSCEKRSNSDPVFHVERSNSDPVFHVERSNSDPVFHVESTSINVFNDLLLLENQLPYFLLEELYNFIHPYSQLRESDNNGGGYHGGSFLELLANYYFTGEVIQKFGPELISAIVRRKPKHFVEYLLNLSEPSHDPVCSTSHNLKHCLANRLVNLRNWYWFSPPPNDDQAKAISLPSATQIHESGITIKKGKSSFLQTVVYVDGELEIPTLHFYDSTEERLRNLVAMEQCHRGSNNNMTDYVMLMDFLINTPNDVALLRSRGVIENWLGSDENVSQLINDIAKGVVACTNESRYSQIYKEVTAYCNTPCHRWRAKLRSQYFSSPWSVISLIAAVVLLICTLVQTLCSMFSGKN